MSRTLIVTDLCFPESLEPADIDEIIGIANRAEPNLREIVLGALRHEATHRENEPR